MQPTVIFDRVSKKFKRGSVHDSLRDMIPAIGRKLLRRKTTAADTAREFWALKDLSFEVKPGEVLGIIGPNGAGKSTTLKILNRIMEPTTGVAYASGKIGALIEVSAGFHQDLTGRQNVFLQGAIMGMRKAEIVRKFDAIVEFAGLSDFIDTPVKRYSSGMNARLGFSIAAHLEPDILIIDEVLAVGDHAFQKRAFARVKEMARDGAPVVLVSHQLDRIAELCTKAVLLERGAVRLEGTPLECINAYLHGGASSADIAQSAEQSIRFRSIRAPNGLAVHSGEQMLLVVEGESLLTESNPHWTPAFRVSSTQEGMVVHAVTGLDRGILLPVNSAFRYEISMQMNLLPGLYLVDVCIWDTSVNSDAINGPRIQVEVLERNKFWGSNQLNADWSEIKVAQ